MHSRLGCCFAALTVVIVAGGCGPKVDSVSLAEYEQVQTGMSYQEVVKIVGREGMTGSGPVGGGPNAVDFEWSNQDGSMMQCVFEHNKLVRKTQQALK